MTTRAQQLVLKINEVVGLGILGAAAINTVGSQYLAKKRREEKVRQAGFGDELDNIKKQRWNHHKANWHRILIGQDRKDYNDKARELKNQHRKIINKGLAGQAKLFSQSGVKAQNQMQVR